MQALEEILNQVRAEAPLAVQERSALLATKILEDTNRGREVNLDLIVSRPEFLHGVLWAVNRTGTLVDQSEEISQEVENIGEFRRFTEALRGLNQDPLEALKIGAMIAAAGIPSDTVVQMVKDYLRGNPENRD